jgi:hypothetical protein
MATSVTVIGLDKVIRRFDKFKNKAYRREPLYEMGDVGVEAIESNFKGNPLGWRGNAKSTKRKKGHSQILVGGAETYGSSALSESIDFKVEANAIIRFFSTERQKAIWATKGTRPHTITGNLAFIGENGRMVFRKSVRHPGTVARKFMVIRPFFATKMREILRRWLKEK